MYSVKFRSQTTICFKSLMLAVMLTGCVPPGLYYWGDYETSLFERYVENNPQHTDAYLTKTLIEAEKQHRKVPPGVYADYGFLLYTRGDKAGAIENFQKERALYPESLALMNKLIERIQQKEKSADVASAPSVEQSATGEQK
ncbi:hypothetical protein Metme_0023 [Methylomonas methanica MC09]|uniref:DUF4810 domain-containing protein n=1 Tax=Methylomonas methanica (strain DSM 25384 / MC09) TaxID=857087 RepID=F9ZX19_METMM|nr:hypothetical protein Metme_0023 [Methylomonas methanica MC09]